MDVIDFGNDFELEVKSEKTLYNTDDHKPASDWVREELKLIKEDKILFPHLSSACIVSDKDNQKVFKNFLGTACLLSNNINENVSGVFISSGVVTKGNANIALSIVPENFLKVTALFTARKSIKSTWLNSKDEYLAPDESHLEYRQFAVDSIVFSLFNDGSNQSSLRSIVYKEKTWDIVNEFFWLSKTGLKGLAEQYYYDELYTDSKNSDDRFVYGKLYGENLVDELSSDARAILDQASELLHLSFPMRRLYAESKPKLQLSNFDAGYAQLKGLWKEYFPTEFKKFRDDYKKFSERMSGLVYEVGFLRK
jgi:hypothetical protein